MFDISVYFNFAFNEDAKSFLFFQIGMEYHINDDGKMMTEGIGLHYRDKYIKITTPAMEGKTPAIIMHDTTEVKFTFLAIVCFNLKLLHILLFDMTT